MPHRPSFVFTFAVVYCVFLSFAGEMPSIGIISVPSLSQRNAVAAMKIPVYWDFEDRLLVSCAKNEIAAIKRAGLSFFHIGEDLYAGSYYLVVSDPAESYARGTNVLWQTGTWLLIHATEAEAVSAREAGVKLLELPSRPHVLSPRMPSPPLSPIKKDTLVGQCIGLVRSDSILNYIRTMQNFQTRYSFAANCRKAEEYVYNFFKALQLDSVAYDEWSITVGKARNVIATQVGTVRPDSIMIISGHLDAISDKYATNAPGADDDASGVAGVMEAARVLSKAEFRWTIKYIAFTGEEQWMKGSGHWVTTVAVPLKCAIFGAYNLDMIGYPPYADKNLMHVFPNTASTILGEMAAQINTTYQIGLTVKHPVDNNAVGDHTPFWQNGYKAVFVIEAPETAIWSGVNPHYHKTSDTLGNLSPNLLHKTIKMTTGCIAQFAGPAGITATTVASGKAHGVSGRFTITKAAGIFRWNVSLPDPVSRASMKVVTPQGKLVYSSPAGPGLLTWKGIIGTAAAAPNGVYVILVSSENEEAAFRIVIAR